MLRRQLWLPPYFCLQLVTISCLDRPGLGACTSVMGTVMVSVTRYRQYAADCVRQAQGEEAAEDKTIMLNVALAWLRLAQQAEARNGAENPSIAPEEVDHHEWSR